MAIQLKVPEVGESITQVQIGEWQKAEGDTVRRDEILVMIETDKVTVELPAPADGVLTKITVQAGEEVSVGTVIGELQEGQVPAASAPAKSSEAAKRTPAALEVPKARTDSTPGTERTGAERRSTTSADEPRIMPAAARLMAERGLTSSQVTPTGPGGRVLKEDVQRVTTEAKITHSPTSRPPPSARYREEELVRMSPLRQRIAERLLEAQKSAALLTTFNEVDMSAAMALRKQYQEDFKTKYGIKLGFMSFFVKAAVDALKLVPVVNAEVRGDSVAYRNYCDIGVAVGSGKGLVVPVIRNAERLSFANVEQTIAEFAGRAQKNQLKLEELQGGTFTISNGGVYGSMMSTPILNPPQSGILGLHAITDRAVVIDGQVVVRPMMYLALTYDHRIVDGRDAVTFLKRIKETIEAPARLLLEV